MIQITDDPSAERTAPPRSTHVRSGDVSSFLIKQGGRHLRGALGRKDSSLAAPFLGGRAKAAPPSPLALYIVGGEGGQQQSKPWRLPLPPVTPLPPRLRLAKPCRDPATSTTTPSCYWISINLSSPLAGSRRRRRRCSVRVLNAEVPSVRR